MDDLVGRMTPHGALAYDLFQKINSVFVDKNDDGDVNIDIEIMAAHAMTWDKFLTSKHAPDDLESSWEDLENRLHRMKDEGGTQADRLQIRMAQYRLLWKGAIKTGLFDVIPKPVDEWRTT